MNPTPPTLGDLFGKAVAGLPKYLAEWTVSLLIVIMSETLVTTITVLAVLAGFALHSVLLGFTTFFAVYSLSRIVYLVASAIAGGTNQIAGAVAQSGQQVFHPASYEGETTQILVQPGP